LQKIEKGGNFRASLKLYYTTCLFEKWRSRFKLIGRSTITS